MKTMALLNGDLVVRSGEGYATVSGAAKVQQELALALGEAFGTDRFHPEWGSTLQNYIGTPLTDMAVTEVQAEVSRVIASYIAIQDQEVYQDFLEGRRSRYAAADIVRSVTDIQVRVSLTTILLSVNLVTQAGTEVTLNRTVTL